MTRENFGCGSSREHAPWALEVNEITCVIAQNYARIFRQNMFNCGLLAIELPEEMLNEIFSLSGKPELVCNIDTTNKKLLFTWAGGKNEFSFSLTGFDEALVQAGGWVEFADARY